MSIAGGLFDSGKKEEKAGDTKSTADGDATASAADPVDLTTSIPGFDDDGDEGYVIGDGEEFRDVEGDLDHAVNVDVESAGSSEESGDFDYDVDAVPEGRLDPES